MKQFKNQDGRLVILNNEEYEIINKALNNRMCYLQKKQEEQENRGWATNEWRKCLTLQVEWFDL